MEAIHVPSVFITLLLLLLFPFLIRVRFLFNSSPSASQLAAARATASDLGVSAKFSLSHLHIPPNSQYFGMRGLVMVCHRLIHTEAFALLLSFHTSPPHSMDLYGRAAAAPGFSPSPTAHLFVCPAHINLSSPATYTRPFCPPSSSSETRVGSAVS